MTERAGRYAAIGLLVLIGASIAVPADRLPLAVGGSDRSALDAYEAALDGLGADPVVVVGFDADLATYGEIRGTVRAALDDLLGRGAALAVVSYTPEGRALAIAEMDRLAAGAAADRLIDLGFVSGAEAGLVRSVGRLTPIAGGRGAELLPADSGLGSFAAALIVGGMDMGPRAWVEQVAPRAPDLPLLAIAPTILWPELAPYRASGQLDALLGTIRDGAALAASVGGTDGPDVGLRPLPLLVGMLAALGVLLRTAAGPVSHRRGAEPGPEDRP